MTFSVDGTQIECEENREQERCDQRLLPDKERHPGRIHGAGIQEARNQSGDTTKIACSKDIQTRDREDISYVGAYGHAQWMCGER